MQICCNVNVTHKAMGRGLHKLWPAIGVMDENAN